MLSRRRLLYYLLLNVFVSACVTLSILYVYENNYRAVTAVSRPSVAGSTAEFEIAAIVGAGLPDSEMILVRNTGQTTAELKDWQIRDADGNNYTFGALNLPANAAIQLRTAPGKDSVIDLYWGLSSSLWSSGETASLLDPDGNVRSSYQVP
ncbi:MAG: lamin tail domain-containing protein [Anaerolineae bacterium]|nr:lamin tail domain-containing protein [Anaerolineae bacterium]